MRVVRLRVSRVRVAKLKVVRSKAKPKINLPTQMVALGSLVATLGPRLATFELTWGRFWAALGRTRAITDAFKCRMLSINSFYQGKSLRKAKNNSLC